MTMVLIKGLMSILLFFILYIVPLVLFLIYARKLKKNKFLLSIIGIIYIVLCLFVGALMNLLPFILTLFTIRYLRVSNINNKEYSLQGKGQEEIEKDYDRYGFDLRSFRFSKGMKYAATSYGVTFLISVIFYLIFTVLKFDLKQQEIITKMMESPIWEFLLTAPVAIFFAPVLEEFVFRWFIFEKVFRNGLGIYFGAILSSVLFGMVHFNIRAFPVLVTIGLINCYLIHKKGYWYAVFNHLIFNLVTTTMLLLGKMHF